MQLTDFIQAIEQEFEDITPGTLTDVTEFRKVEGWSSMMALILIARIDSEYSVTVTAEELARCKTINDLFQVVQAKVA